MLMPNLDMLSQIFELWERPGSAGDRPQYYVKCIYNHEELSLAHHPNGQSCFIFPAKAQYRVYTQHVHDSVQGLS